MAEQFYSHSHSRRKEHHCILIQSRRNIAIIGKQFQYYRTFCTCRVVLREVPSEQRQP
jgi:hypothetical protein